MKLHSPVQSAHLAVLIGRLRAACRGILRGQQNVLAISIDKFTSTAELLERAERADGDAGLSLRELNASDGSKVGERKTGQVIYSNLLRNHEIQNTSLVMPANSRAIYGEEPLSMQRCCKHGRIFARRGLK